MSGRAMRMVLGAAGPVIFFIITSVSCSARSDLPGTQVTTPMDVAPEKVVVVGRIELRPPLQPGEQQLKTGQGGQMKNIFILYCGDQLRDLANTAPEDYEGAYTVTLDKEFFIKADRLPVLYCSGGRYYAVYDPPAHLEPRTFSSPFRIELRPGDRAVYIGTIQYYRDPAGALRSVMVRDDYQWAEGRFRELFGAGQHLRKSLVIRVPEAEH